MTPTPVRQTRSTCPYCGVGCGVIIESAGTQIVGVRGDPDHPANFGRLCSKGSTLHLTAAAATHATRLFHPMRRCARGQEPSVISWDEALDEAARRFGEIIEQHGPDAVGFYISGQLLTEDYYVFNKLARGLIGTNHIDSNSRLCMSSAVAAYKQAFGADAPPACYADIDHADVIFIAGANPAFAHPILFRRIEQAKEANPALKIIVADPRRTETAELADLHLPLLPGSDIALFHGMLHVMVWERLIDDPFIATHTVGFDDLKRVIVDFTPRQTAQLCGLDAEAIVQAARWFAQSRATLSLYCQGLNQSRCGTDKNAALINLHLATGQIGRPGAGPFSLTGQPNAMGGREVGAMATLLSGHRDWSNPAHRAEVAQLWGVKALPDSPGKTAVELFEAAAQGQIKALWIACTNPAQSMPNQEMVRRALKRCEFVVVQEAYAHTATCAYADLLLPAATWGEKEGTVTNSERRISRVRAAVPPPGEARPDWRIVVDFARRLEARWPSRRNGLPTLFPYNSPEEIWNEHRESTRGRDLDITGLSYGQLERAPQQWPCPEGGMPRARLYEDGRFPTPDGRARFVAVTYQPLAEPRDARYPFSLITGRLRDQWHGMSRTGLLGRLFGHVSEPAVQLNPRDMARLGLQEGDLVELASRRGFILLPVQGSEQLAPSQAFLPMHWGEEFLSGASDSGEALAGVNTLTTSVFCPISKQPELKHAAVRIRKATLPWTLLGAAWLPAEHAYRAIAALRTLMRQFSYASCVPFGNEPNDRGVLGVLLRAAAPAPPGKALLDTIEQILELAAADALRYVDQQRGQRRTLRLTRGRDASGDLRLEAFMVAGNTGAGSWLLGLLQSEEPIHGDVHTLLAPSAQALTPRGQRSRQVCTCLNVTESEILATLAQCQGNAEERLQQLQAVRGCGTQCGSCVPELRRMVRIQLECEVAS